MALADPNPCHLLQGSLLCTALGVGSGLGRSLVLEQHSCATAPFAGRLQQEQGQAQSAAGVEALNVLCCPRFCCPLFLELEQGSWMIFPHQGGRGSQGSYGDRPNELASEKL